jgi:chromosome segregation ATPase
MHLGRKKPEPVRAHPDPDKEHHLAQIRSLKRRTQVKEKQVQDYSMEIEKLHVSMRKTNHMVASGSWSPSTATPAINRQQAQVVTLQEEVRKLDKEVDLLHNEIAARMQDISETDLSYL